MYEGQVARQSASTESQPPQSSATHVIFTSSLRRHDLPSLTGATFVRCLGTQTGLRLSVLFKGLDTESTTLTQRERGLGGEGQEGSDSSQRLDI